MPTQENSVRLTRLAAKKRAAEPFSADQPAAKKRAVLGDISNLPNSQSVLNPKCKSKKIVNKPQSQDVVCSESDDPQMCTAYSSEIYEYLRQMEIEPKRRPLPDYVEKIQKDVSVSMRAILVDWLVEVSEEYKLLPETLYLAISYIDRFLSMNVLQRQKLQLLGVSSMLIASKYEEIHPPNVEDFCYITDNTYSKQDMVKMEADVLKSLKFEMGNPTINVFLRKFTKVAQEDYDNEDSLLLENLGCFLAELSLLDYSCVKFLPSTVAASVIFLSRFTMKPNSHPWSLALANYSGYKAADLKECVVILHDLQCRKRLPALEAVRTKYKSHKYKFATYQSSPSTIPEMFFKNMKTK